MDNELQLVAFTIDNQEFAVNILVVQEIEKIVNITRVPKAPFALEGVINLRGEVIPVINLRKRLNLTLKDITESDKIVIIKANNLTVGVIVDGVTEVVRLEQRMIETSPSLNENVEANYVQGVGKLGDRLLVLLDPAVILDLERQKGQTG